MFQHDCHTSHSGSLIQYQCNSGPWNVIVLGVLHDIVWQSYYIMQYCAMQCHAIPENILQGNITIWQSNVTKHTIVYGGNFFNKLSQSNPAVLPNKMCLQHCPIQTPIWVLFFIFWFHLSWIWSSALLDTRMQGLDFMQHHDIIWK